MFTIRQFFDWLEKNFGYILIASVIGSLLVAYSIAQVAGKLLAHFGINL